MKTETVDFVSEAQAVAAENAAFDNSRAREFIVKGTDTGTTRGGEISSLKTTVVNKSILSEASDIIYGDREETYGHPAKNLVAIADLWNTYLHTKFLGKSLAEVNLTAEDVCWMMVQLKMARQMNSSKRDNLVDASGYIALIERLG